MKSFSVRRAIVVVVAGLALVAGVASPAQAGPPVSKSTGKGCTAYTYRATSTSTCAKYIQIMLNGIRAEYGIGSYLVEDGVYGQLSAAQVKRFQKWTQLVQDGVVGPRTWNELCFYAGQVAFWYTGQTRKNRAWNAAYSAGCWVEYGYGTTFKWKSRY